MFSVAECNLGLRWPCTGVCLYGLSCRSLCMAFHLHLSLPTLLAIVDCLFAPTAPTISCLHRVTVVITWVGKYFHWFISVEADGCRFQGFHGYQHTCLSSRTTPPNPRHLPQAHPLAMSLIQQKISQQFWLLEYFTAKRSWERERTDLSFNVVLNCHSYFKHYSCTIYELGSWCLDFGGGKWSFRGKGGIHDEQPPLKTLL